MAPPLFRSRSLRSAFGLVVASSYVVTLLLFILSAAVTMRSVSDRYARRFAGTRVELEKDRIVATIDRDLVLSQKLADDPIVRAWMKNEADGALERSAREQLESYRSFLRDKAYFVAVASSGSYYARTPDTGEVVRTILSEDNPADRWLYRTLNSGDPYELNVNYDALLDENRVWINVVVQDPANGGMPIGVAGCGMDLTKFLKAMVGTQVSGMTTAVVDYQGRFQAYDDAAVVEHNARAVSDADKVDLYSLLRDPKDLRNLKSALADSVSRTVDPFPLHFDGQRRVAAIGAMPDLGWYVVCLVDPSSVLGLTDFLPLVVAGGLALLLVLSTTAAATRTLVLKPLEKLTGAAKVIAEGAYDVELPVRERNEIGLLSESFNRMTAKVRSYINGLESMVRERTAALEGANRQIMDSIEYARLIQDSVLPPRSLLDQGLGSHGELLLPRDTVGGDFYYFRADARGFWAAVIDCTGHGVPGALMTMMTSPLLDRAIDTAGGRGPAAVLNALHASVQASLKADRSHLDNGLDIALVRYLRGGVGGEERAGELLFSGAGLSLFLGGLAAGAAPGKEVVEFRGDRTRLGYTSISATQTWKEERIPLDGPRIVYLVSDGVLDLHGGERGFPLGRSGFLEILEDLGSYTMADRCRHIQDAFDAYSGDLPARDDLCLFAFEVR